MGIIDNTANALRSAAARVFGPRPSTSRIVVVRKADRRDLRQLPPGVGAWDRRFEEVQAIIASHELGSFRASGILADVIERNPRVMGALNNRALGVLGAPFSMLPGLGDRRRAAAVARAAELDWSVMLPEETSAEMLRGLTSMGFCVARVGVVTVNGRWVPTLDPWHPSFLRWDPTRRCLMALTDLMGEVPVTPGAGWLVLASSSVRPWMRGVVRCLGLPSETRSYAVRDWGRWSEKHGQPWIELKVPASKQDSDEASEFFEQMRDVGAEPVIVSPQGDKDQASFGVNLIEAKDTAWEGFKELIARQDGDVSIAIEGQNLSVENTGTGTYASAKIGHGIRQDLREADAWLLASTVHEQLLRVWAEWNFGDAGVAPWAVYDPTPPEDLSAAATTMKTAGEALTAWQTLAAARGLTVDLEELAERFGIPLIAATAPTEASPTSTPEGEEQADPETARARASARRFLARHLRHQRIAA